ncbi:CoA transferase [Nocardiopsis sp. HUAS JQ3]|uniref:CoA transferase n=1 Tax=Nocardiopsis sp. HUAS JQ3 TaxID=3061629 RepID=UPI0023AA010C|nr:CoA transferase [Nocardiopsis sp. HUAS JQ3]WDZ93134.1 CoA transferase [Nocardiopsis sp. HUAS JQ3]
MTAEPVDAAPLPLAGAAARAVGDSVALRIAAARLEALGCEVSRAEGPLPPQAPAGWIGLVAVPGEWGPGGNGSGAAPGADGSGGGGTRALPVPVGCAIGWSGPVAAPLAGERGVQAACGLAHLHGRARGAPRFLGVDYASVCAGVLAAQAVAACALALARGGPALSASVSAAQAALLAAGPYVAAATAPGQGVPAGSPALDAGGAGTGGGRGAVVPGTVPPFRSADGARFEIETLDAEVWLRFWTGLGAAPAAIAAGWPPFQRRFATAVCPLPPELPAAIAAVDLARVRLAARDAGMSLVLVRAVRDAGEPAPASEWRLRARDAAVTPAAPLAALGPDAAAPLAGLRVVEATNRVQGPLAGLLLAMLGAEVVRIEPPGGDPMRGVAPMAGDSSARFLALNRGKGAVETDLKSAAGRRAARDLAATADVLLYNWPPGRAEGFGLGPDDLAGPAPGLVHVHADGWGGRAPEPGTLATDYLVQAHGGVADLLAGPGQEPAPSLLTLTDVLGGILAAEGAVAALLLRARTGAGVRARTALSDAARLLRRAGRGTATEEGERSVPGPGEQSSPGSGEKSAPAPGEQSFPGPEEKSAPVPGRRSGTGPGQRNGAVPQRWDRTRTGPRGGLVAVECDGAVSRTGGVTAPVESGGPAPGGRIGPVPVEDLAAMAAAPAFAAAFDTVGGASCVRAPWSFAPAADAPSAETGPRDGAARRGAPVRNEPAPDVTTGPHGGARGGASGGTTGPDIPHAAPSTSPDGAVADHTPAENR